MSEPVELTLAIRRERDPYRGGTRLVGTLNVHTMRVLDWGMGRATMRGEEVYYQDVEDAMREDVERHLQRTLPRELLWRIEHALKSNPLVPHYEAMELVDKLRAGTGFKVKSVRVPDDRRDEWIEELKRKLDHSSLMSRLRIEKLETQLRHEQLRGRLFKKGKKGVRRG